MSSLRLLRPIGSVLNREVGWTWPALLLASLWRSRAVFRKTHWSSPSAPAAEARYVRRLALFPALYLELVDRLGEGPALEKYGRIASTFGVALERQALASFKLSHLAGMERFMAFRARMDKSDADRFNVKEYLTADDTTCHYVLRRCVAHDFLSEAGTPELTRFFCRADELFFCQAFPDLAFSRGGSWENTIAYGKDRCEYVLTTKEVPHA